MHSGPARSAARRRDAVDIFAPSMDHPARHLVTSLAGSDAAAAADKATIAGHQPTCSEHGHPQESDSTHLHTVYTSNVQHAYHHFYIITIRVLSLLIPSWFVYCRQYRSLVLSHFPSSALSLWFLVKKILSTTTPKVHLGRPTGKG